MESGQAQHVGSATADAGEVRPGHWLHGGVAPDDREKQIARILGEFNFERVHRAMLAIDWRWYVHADRGFVVPSIERLRACATDLLRMVARESSVGTGGFEAHCCAEGSLTLAFTLDSAEGDEWVAPLVADDARPDLRLPSDPSGREHGGRK